MCDGTALTISERSSALGLCAHFEVCLGPLALVDQLHSSALLCRSGSRLKTRLKGMSFESWRAGFPKKPLVTYCRFFSRDSREAMVLLGFSQTLERERERAMVQLAVIGYFEV